MSAKTKKNKPVNRIATVDRPETTHDEIALCARSIWEAEGFPQGRDLEHWLLAEARLRQRCQAGADGATDDQPRRITREDSKRNRTGGVTL